MADKTAQIKLTLKSDGFKAGMADAEKAAKKSTDGIGKSITGALSKAASEGFGALKSTLSNLKSAAMGFAGIAGGLGIAELGRRALTAEGQFRALAFRIKAGTGVVTDWRSIQKEAQATALKWGHTSEEVGKSISDLYAAVGDPKFARNASKVVAEVATGSHESLETMTNLAGTLNEKFGISSDQLGETLASVVSLGNKGGVSVEDLSEKIGIIGANARVAGLDGKKGFELMVGMLNIADNATGTLKKGITGVSSIIDSISTGSAAEPLKKKLGFDLEKAKKQGLEFDDILGQIIEKSGGSQEKLGSVFSGDALKVVTELSKTFYSAYDEAAGTQKEKQTAAWAAYVGAIKDASKSSLSLADIQKEAAEAMETPEKKIATALEKLAQQFTDPKVTDAFKKFADFIPKVVDQIIKHPILTGAILSGVPQAIAGSLIKSIGDAIGGGLKGLFSGGMGGAPAQLATTAAVAGGAYILGREIIDQDISAMERQQDVTRAASLESGDLLTNSRGQVLSGEKEAFDLAKEADVVADDLADRVRLARVVEKFGKNSDEAIDLSVDLADRAMKAGRGNRIADLDESSEAMRDQAGTDAENLFLVMKARDDARQAGRNYRERGRYGPGGYYDPSNHPDQFDANGRFKGDDPLAALGRGDVALSQMMGTGVGLGGPIVTNRQRREAAEKQAEEAKAAKVEAQNKAQNDALANSIAGKELKVRLTNASEVGDAVAKAAPPTPGSTPRP